MILAQLLEYSNYIRIMKWLALITFLTMPFGVLSAEKDSSERRFRYIEFLDIEVGKIYPFSKEFRQSSFKNYLSFGITANFLPLKLGNRMTFTQQIGGTFSGKNHKKLIEGIVFEDDYRGGIHADSYRFSALIGTTFRYRLGKNVEIGLPFNYVARWWGYGGSFYLNEGQNIEPDDVVTGHEAGVANKFEIYKSFAHGFKTGFELALIGDSRFSLFTQFTFQFFPGMEVYDLPNASFNQVTGDLNIPNTFVNNGTDIRFIFGIRTYVYRIVKSEDPVKTGKSDPDVILTPKKRGK